MRHSRLCGLKLALVIGLILGAAPAADAAVTGAGGPTLGEQIRKHRLETWHWQRVMGRPRTPKTAKEKAVGRIGYRIRVRTQWRERARKARREAKHPPHLSAWRCIHRYEGAWTDPNAPYYGGLQMDLAFQRAYGPRLLRTKGTADNWTPLEQMWRAERALRAGRGFYPWPVTARRCGLL